MIQRIQSVYLLLGALCLAALSILDPIWQSQAAATLAWYVPTVAILGALTAIVALIAIFLHKDRQKQLKTILAVQMLAVVFLVVLVGGLFLGGDFDSGGAAGGGGALDRAILLALLLPVASYVFFYLARRGVQRDINLVRSMDRLR